MYPVSKAFQTAIKKPYRKERIHGLLWLFNTDGQITGSKSFDEDAIVQGSLAVTDQLTNGKFGYGGAYVRNLKVKLDTNKINGLNPININLTNAQIFLWYYLTLEDETEESVFLGQFYINSKNSSRKFNILSIVAEDTMTKFDVASVPMSYTSPYQIYTKACELAGVEAATTQEEFTDFPNSTMSVSFDTSQIQSARDMLMWTAKLTGTIAHTNNGKIKLIQIPTKYTQGGTAYNFDLDAFKEDNGTIIPADIRFKTDYTDTSVRITTIVMNRRDERIEYRNSWTFASDTLEGTMEIEDNPLLKSAYPYVAEEAVKALAQYTDDLRFCPSTVQLLNGNPAIEIGDFVFLEKGGGMDDTTYRHYMIVTYSKWVYGGKHEIRCATDVAAERPKTSAAVARKARGIAGVNISEPMALAVSADTGENNKPIAPKSQLEKSVRSASQFPDRLVINNAVAQLQDSNGYGVGMDFRDNSEASANRKYIGHIEFYDGGNNEIALRVQLGSRGYAGSSEIVLLNPGRTICQEGSIQYGNGSDYTYGGGQICLNAKEGNNNKPVELRFNSAEGYSYAMQFSPSGVTFSNGKGGSFTIPFTTTVKEEEQ